MHQSTGDADTMIVHCALQLATHGTEVMVVEDDTDVLILLIYHWQGQMANVYFLSESSKTQKCWKIRDIAAKAGAGLVSHILFVHAWSGCDTTSATFGQGKTGLLKKIKESPDIQQISSLMIDSRASTEDVGLAGIRLFVQ